jgi:uncharacterized protein YbjT (DUF2867 family)
MKMPLILVTGATGTVGSEVVKQLAEVGHWVRALVRDPEKAKKFGAQVEIATGNLEKPETLGRAFAGVDKAFVLSTGPLLATLEGNAFEAAKTAGVKHIVKLSGRHIGADFMAGAPLVQWHATSEQWLQTLGVPWTILRPGSFASNFLAWLDRKQSAILLPVGDGKDSFIDPRDIAAVAVRLLTTPGHDGRIYEITGSEWLDFSQAAQKLSTAIGKPVSYTNISEETARRGMLLSGIPPAYADSILRYLAGIRAGKIYAPTAAVQDLLGRPPRSFDDWSRDNAAALK